MGGGCGEPKSLRAVYSCVDGSPSAKSDSGFSSDVVFSRHAPRVCLRSSGALAVAPAVLVVSVPSHNLHTAVTLGGRSFRDTTYWGGALLPFYVAPNNHRPTTAAPTDHDGARPSTPQHQIRPLWTVAPSCSNALAAFATATRCVR